MPTITKPYGDFTNNVDVADANKVNQQLNTLYNWANGNVDLANINASAMATTATAGKLAKYDSNSDLPTAYPVSTNQNPNLLFNGGLALGSNGWTDFSSGKLVFGTDKNNGKNVCYLNTAITTTTINVESISIPINPGIQITVSGLINAAGVTAGSVWIEVHAFNGATDLGGIAFAQATNGTGYAKYSATATTPANTTKITVRLVCSNATITQYGLDFAQIKVENSAFATTFSDDNTLNTLQYGSILGLAQVLSGGYKEQSGVSASISATQNAWVTLNVTFPTAFSTAPQEIQLTLIGAQVRAFITVTSITATGFTINVYNTDATASITVGWEATAT